MSRPEAGWTALGRQTGSCLPGHSFIARVGVQATGGATRGMFDDDFEKLKYTLIFDKISKAAREDPKKCSEYLELLGLTWVDGENEQDLIKENLASPQNLNQEFLVAYFEGHIRLTEKVLNAYLRERQTPVPDEPLIRRYFRRGNEPLLSLILFGLSKKPTDKDLIADLSLYHEFRNVINDLIQVYLKACVEEQDLFEFQELVLDFYYDTEPEGFDALFELGQLFDPFTDKGKVIRRIIRAKDSEMNPAEIE
jgi:hypothetical protein